MPIDLNVTVLTMGLWPTQAPSPCALPSEIETCCSIFQDYYLNKNSSRKLTWHPNMGTAELKASFPNGRYEITVSTFQVCILLLFNKSDVLSYKSIQDHTNIAADDLKRNLMALTCGKHKILLKSDVKTKKIEESDKFAFNKSFKSKLYRFKLMVVSGKDSQVDTQSSETRQKVDEERKAQIDACIVRIMKSRKKMDHSQLVNEVVRLLSSRFVPNPTVVKRRIESLIEREFVCLFCLCLSFVCCFGFSPPLFLFLCTADGTLQDRSQGLPLLRLKRSILRIALHLRQSFRSINHDFSIPSIIDHQSTTKARKKERKEKKEDKE